LVLSAAGFTAATTELLPSGLLPEISRELGVQESAVGALTGFTLQSLCLPHSPCRGCSSVASGEKHCSSPRSLRLH
jgi:hypothetical protein